MICVLAGASFPCGAGDLGEVAQRRGYAVRFVDHPRHAAAVDEALKPLTLNDTVPAGWGQSEGILIPVLESWVTAALALPASCALRFDRRAATLSRSKVALSEAVAAGGLPSAPRTRVEGLAEALAAARGGFGYPLVLRLDAGYSGRGVWVVDSERALLSGWEAWRAGHQDPGVLEMKAILDSGAERLVAEPWLEGEEWSVDCAVGPAGALLIRACEKATALQGGQPVTLGYRLVGPGEQVWRELEHAAAEWGSVLFDGATASFATFDIRRAADGALVPLDFGARLGGDEVPRLVRLAGAGVNPYAVALDGVLTKALGRRASLTAGLALVHAFAEGPGVLEGVTLEREGQLVSTRPRGYTLPVVGDRAVGCKVASAVIRLSGPGELRSACASAPRWLRAAVRPPA